MPRPLEIALTFEDNFPVPVTGQRVRPGSISAQVKQMKIGQSVFLTEKTHVSSFSAAVKKHRTDARVVTQTEKNDKGVTGTRCWLANATIKTDEPTALANAASK